MGSEGKGSREVVNLNLISNLRELLNFYMFSPVNEQTTDPSKSQLGFVDSYFPTKLSVRIMFL